MVWVVTCDECLREFTFRNRLDNLLSFWYRDKDNDIDVCPGCLLHDAVHAKVEGGGK